MRGKVNIKLFPSWDKNLPFPEDLLPEITEEFSAAMNYMTRNKKWSVENLPDGLTVRDFELDNWWPELFQTCEPSIQRASIDFANATGIHPTVFVVIILGKAVQLIRESGPAESGTRGMEDVSSFTG